MNDKAVEGCGTCGIVAILVVGWNFLVAFGIMFLWNTLLPLINPQIEPIDIWQGLLVSVVLSAIFGGIFRRSK